MKTELMDLNGKKVKDVNLEKTIFGIEPNDVALKDAIVLGRAALRQGTHKTKTRAEQNRKERKLALKSAYSYKAKENNIVVVDKLELTTPKTKDFVKVLTSLSLENSKTLIIVKEYNENVVLASRNLQNVAIATAPEVSALDVVSANKLLIEEAALDAIKEVLK